MTIQLAKCQARKQVTAKISGHVTRIEIASALSRMCELVGDDPINAILLDARESEMLINYSLWQEAIGDLIASVPLGVRIAYIGPDFQTLDRVVYARAAANDIGRSFECFDDGIAANEWLNSPLETSQG